MAGEGRRKQERAFGQIFMMGYYAVMKNKDALHVPIRNNLQDGLLNGKLKRQNARDDVLLFHYVLFLPL